MSKLGFLATSTFQKKNGDIVGISKIIKQDYASTIFRNDNVYAIYGYCIEAYLY